MSIHPLGPRAAYERAEGYLLNLQTQVGGVEARLREMLQQRENLEADNRIRHLTPLRQLLRRDADALQEPLHLVAAARDTCGAALAALRSDYLRATSAPSDAGERRA